MVEPRREGKDDNEMIFQMHFEPYLVEHVNQRHEELLQEMEALRLKKRLRENRRGQASRLISLFRRALYYMGQGLQGSPSPCRSW